MADIETIEAELGPWLDELEDRRQNAVRRAVRGYVAAGAAAVGIFLVVMLLTPGDDLAFLAAGGAALLIGGAASAPILAMRREIKTGLNSRLAEALGWRYALDPGTPAHFDAFRSHGLLPGHDRRNFEDQFSGTLHGAGFEVCEANLKQRRRSKNRTYYVTVFHGVLMRIRFPRTVEGVTLITRDAGWFNGLSKLGHAISGRKLERIGLVDPTFERVFEVYGTDQVMARYLLTPTFMERLLELERLLDGKNVRACFDENLADGDGQGELLIVAETVNRFEAGSIWRPLTDNGRVRQALEEMKLLQAIIDTLLEPSAAKAGRPA